MIRVTSRLPPVLGSALVLFLAMAGEARAQQPVPPPPPAGAAPPPAPAPPAPPLAAPPPPPLAPPPPPPMEAAPPPPMAVVTPPTPLPLPPEAPAPAPVKETPLRVSGAVRLGLILQDPDLPKKMGELHLDTTGYSNAAELRLGGDVTDYFSWTANFNALIDGGAVGSAGSGNQSTFAVLSIEDLIAQFKAVDAFQIWMGRLLVPSDRANFAGPFFMSPWDYPGFYLKNAPPIGPMEGANGRNQGITVWGNVGPESKFKYFAGIYGIDQGGPNSTQLPADNAFYSARLSYSLQGSEPGYFGSSTWYGDKDITTIAVGGQYKRNGSVDLASTTGGRKDTFVGIADILTEQNVKGTGTFTFEGEFYAFNKDLPFSSFSEGANTIPIFNPREAFYAVVSYLTPENIGVGKFQPLIRWQQTIDPEWTIIDGALAYVMKEYDARLVLTYEHIDTGSTGGPNRYQNSLQFGVQLQK